MRDNMVMGELYTGTDVLVIGAGPGGYVAAIRAAQLGKDVILVDKSDLGGVCLNIGCIPSKALLDSSEHFQNAETKFEAHGIGLSNLKVDFKQMVARKDDVVKGTVAGVSYLMGKNKIDVLQGVGSFKNATQIVVTPDKGDPETIETEKTIIATGSKPSSLPGIEIDKKRIITSTEALNLTGIPKKLILIGVLN